MPEIYDAMFSLANLQREIFDDDNPLIVRVQLALSLGLYFFAEEAYLSEFRALTQAECMDENEKNDRDANGRWWLVERLRVRQQRRAIIALVRKFLQDKLVIGYERQVAEALLIMITGQNNSHDKKVVKAAQSFVSGSLRELAVWLLSQPDALFADFGETLMLQLVECVDSKEFNTSRWMSMMIGEYRRLNRNAGHPKLEKEANF